MNLIIMGCGRVGSRVARALELESHDVAVIDQNPKALEALPQGFRGRKVVGIGFDRDVLLAAGIEEADAFVAVTANDDANVVAALIAKTRFQVPKVIARLFDPGKEKLYQHLGVTTMSATGWAANKIRSLLLAGGMIRHMSFGNGEVEVWEGEVPAALDGHGVSELSLPGEAVVACVVRNGRAFVPTSGTMLKAGDGVVFLAGGPSVAHVRQLLSSI